MCVRNVDVHVSCSSHVNAQLAAFFIDPRAKGSTEVVCIFFDLKHYNLRLPARPFFKGCTVPTSVCFMRHFFISRYNYEPEDQRRLHSAHGEPLASLFNARGLIVSDAS